MLGSPKGDILDCLRCGCCMRTTSPTYDHQTYCWRIGGESAVPYAERVHARQELMGTPDSAPLFLAERAR